MHDRAIKRENRTWKREKRRGRDRASETPHGVYDDEEEEPFRHDRLEGGPFNGAKNDPRRLCAPSPRPPAIGPFNCVHLAPLPYRVPVSSPIQPPDLPSPLFFDCVSRASIVPPRVYLALASYFFKYLATLSTLETFSIEISICFGHYKYQSSWRWFLYIIIISYIFDEFYKIIISFEHKILSLLSYFKLVFLLFRYGSHRSLRATPRCLRAHVRNIASFLIKGEVIT